jgi:signal transduction histidine kinase
VAPENVPRLLPPLPHVRITIQDFGIGISPDHRTRIFDPFFTTKQQGSGLGLATSYSIIKKHDGCIEVESELGEGSAFHI